MHDDAEWPKAILFWLFFFTARCIEECVFSFQFELISRLASFSVPCHDDICIYLMYIRVHLWFG